MKKYVSLTAAFALLGAVLFVLDQGRSQAQSTTQAAGQQDKIPAVIILAKDSKLGKVTFNHGRHNGTDYSMEGTMVIMCTECHHTAQPASQVAKYPPLKTVWPADRTTTLSADLFNKDPKAAGVGACRDCHARAGQVPKLIPEIPVVKQPGTTTLVTLTNQMAFHKACDVCHFEVGAKRPDVKVPNAVMCKSCHVQAAS